MKKKCLSLLLTLPLLLSCGSNEDINVDEHIPSDYTPTLPEIKNKSDGAIKEDDNYVYFDFYEISDFHGAVEYSKSETPESGMLGLERLSTYYDTKRNDNVGGTILLSGGDMWQGTADSNITRGNLVTYSMNIMNFSSMTLGNHEFDWTVDWIKNNKERANFPFLAANLIDKTTNKIADFVEASTIVTRGDYKIGIVGTIGENIKTSIIASAVTNYDFAKEVDTVKSEAEKLRESGCQIVVWSSHNDISYLKSIVGTDDIGVDLIFGGHSHTTYVDQILLGDKVVPMLESKDKGRSLPHAQLKIDKATNEVSSVEGYSCDSTPTSVEYDVDKDIEGIYNQYKEKYINPSKNRYMGKLDGDMDINEPQLAANLAVEVMYKKVEDVYPDITCYASFTNVNGGIRGTLKSGSITYGDIYNVFPFDNEIVIMQTTGAKLLGYVSSGITSTLKNAAHYQTVEKTSNIDRSEKYYFITTDYLASHTSYFAKDDGDTTIYTKINVRDAVAEYFKKKGTIKASEYKTSAKSEFGGPK